MKKEENSNQVNKNSYKLFLVVLKCIPILLAFIHFLNTILSYFSIDAVILSYIGGSSLLPLLFIYIAAYVFKFCIYHRIFLDYVVINNVINIVDFYIGIPITALSLLCIHMFIFFITICIALISHLKHSKNVTKTNK